MRTLRRFAAALGALAASMLGGAAACSVEPLDLTSKECPCVSGYVCDLETNRCLGVTSALEGGVPGVDAREEEAPLPPSLVSVSGLTAVWATPLGIRWSWKLTGSASDFRAYEVVLGATADDVEKRVDVDILTSNERPELGAFDARGGATQGPVETWILSDVRAASSKQFARVQVTDVNGRSSRTAIASGTSAGRALSELIIFDGRVERTAAPAAELVFRRPAGGEAHYALTADCGAAKACAKRAELVGLALDLAPAGNPFTAADFERAFLELTVEGTFAVTSFDSLVGLAPGNTACAPANAACRFGLSGITQRPAARTRLQVPLRELRTGADKLTYAALQAKSFQVEAFLMAGTWKAGAVLRLYDARIRW